MAWKSVAFRLSICCAIFIAAAGCAGLTVKDVEAKYGSVQPHWIGTPQRIDALIEIGQIQDPSTTNGQIVPPRFGNPGLIEGAWFKLAPLKRIDVFITPIISKDQYWNFGPKSGDPIGVYAYETRDEGDAACDEYEKATEAFKARFDSSFHTYERSAPQGKCLTYRYVGPLELKNYHFIYVTYFDSVAYKNGYGLLISELRNMNNVSVARSVACTANFEVKQIQNCNGTDQLFKILMPAGEGG